MLERVREGAGAEVRLPALLSVAAGRDDALREREAPDDGTLVDDVADGDLSEDSFDDDSSEDELLVDAEEDEPVEPGSFEPLSCLKRLMHPPMSARRRTTMMRYAKPVFALPLPEGFSAAGLAPWAHVALGSLTRTA